MMNRNKLFDSKKSQSGLLPIILVVVGLVSVATVLTGINITGFFALNESNETLTTPSIIEIPVNTIPTETPPITTPVETPPIENIPIVGNITNVIPDIGSPNVTQGESNVTSPTQIINETDATLPKENVTQSVENITENVTLPVVNVTVNITQPAINVTINITQPVENVTINKTPVNTTPTETPPIVLPLPIVEKPSLNITIESPSKITRGSTIIVKSVVTNTGSVEAKNVVLSWKLPSGFEIVSGNQTENCGNLELNNSCTSIISVQTSFSTVLGLNKIKVVVTHE